MSSDWIIPQRGIDDPEPTPVHGNQPGSRKKTNDPVPTIDPEPAIVHKRRRIDRDLRYDEWVIQSHHGVLL